MNVTDVHANSVACSHALTRMVQWSNDDILGKGYSAPYDAIGKIGGQVELNHSRYIMHIMLRDIQIDCETHGIVIWAKSHRLAQVYIGISMIWMYFSWAHPSYLVHVDFFNPRWYITSLGTDIRSELCHLSIRTDITEDESNIITPNEPQDGLTRWLCSQIISW